MRTLKYDLIILNTKDLKMSIFLGLNNPFKALNGCTVKPFNDFSFVLVIHLSVKRIVFYG
jgi:hypothetical protein